MRTLDCERNQMIKPTKAEGLEEEGWPCLRGGVTFAWTIGDSSAA